MNAGPDFTTDEHGCGFFAEAPIPC